MAPVLQCPDCGTKHPLGSIPHDVSTFPCEGCGRKLKVPESVPGRAPAAPAPAPAVPPAAAAATAATVAAATTPPPTPDATQAMPAAEPANAEPVTEAPVAEAPVVEQKPAPTPKPKREKQQPAPVGSSVYAPVAWWIRLLLWIVAVPLAYFLVFELARVVGLFTSSNLSDVFLANGVSRFWPVARLLPVVALFTAAIVQGGVMVLGRRKARQGAGAGAAAAR